MRSQEIEKTIPSRKEKEAKTNMIRALPPTSKRQKR